jgi:hypothetical protein
MANQDVKVTNFPKEESRHRVAFDLMNQIASYEDVPQDKAREYYLTLYRQCLGIVLGRSLADAMGTKSVPNFASF